MTLDYSIEDHATDVTEKLASTLEEALKAAYDEGHGKGWNDATEEIMEGEGPVGALIATVKEFQVRQPNFSPRHAYCAPRFYDSLLSFLETGELPLEWQP